MEEAKRLSYRGGLRFWFVSLQEHVSKKGNPKYEIIKLGHDKTYFDGLAGLMGPMDTECQYREVPYCLALVLLPLPELGL